MEKVKNKAIELLRGDDEKLSRTGLMFLVWMTFLMFTCGYVSISTKKVADLPEAYVYITLVLCSTYTARRFLDSKYPSETKPTNTTTPPTP